MKATIEIKEITLDSANQFMINSYPNEGIYLVSGKDIESQYVIAIKKAQIVYYVGLEKDIKHMFSNTQEPKSSKKPTIEHKLDLPRPEEISKPSGVISESFALKMLSIAVCNDKYKDVE